MTSARATVQSCLLCVLPWQQQRWRAVTA
jgi:hypothetical protein